MRYLPLTDTDRREMLAAIGVSSVDELYRDVPSGVLLDKPVDLPHHKSEMEVERTIGSFAEKNKNTTRRP